MQNLSPTAGQYPPLALFRVILPFHMASYAFLRKIWHYSHTRKSGSPHISSNHLHASSVAIWMPATAFFESCQYSNSSLRSIVSFESPVCCKHVSNRSPLGHSVSYVGRLSHLFTARRDTVLNTSL